MALFKQSSNLLFCIDIARKIVGAACTRIPAIIVTVIAAWRLRGAPGSGPAAGNTPGSGSWCRDRRCWITRTSLFIYPRSTTSSSWFSSWHNFCAFIDWHFGCRRNCNCPWTLEHTVSICTVIVFQMFGFGARFGFGFIRARILLSALLIWGWLHFSGTARTILRGWLRMMSIARLINLRNQFILGTAAFVRVGRRRRPNTCFHPGLK